MSTEYSGASCQRRLWAFFGVAAAVRAASYEPSTAHGSCSAGTGGWAHNTRNILPDVVFIPKLSDPAACCAACVDHAASHGCHAWTSNVSGCGLKHASWEKGGYSGSTSGTIASPPGPPYPPSPAPHPGPPAPPLPPVPPPLPGTCRLTESGPIVVDHDGQIVENLRIVTTTKQPGIYIVGHKNVVIRNCTIEHRAQTVWPFGNGIYFTGADNLTIMDVAVELVGINSGPTPDLHNYNINGLQSAGVRIANVRVIGGSTGVELNRCDAAHIANFVAMNVRGPYPRGQCFQCGESDDVVLEDFYCMNDNTSWTEDSISLWRSSNVTVRRGLIDGNNSPTGVGVMFEQDDRSKHGGLCQDVDAVHMGDGCFSAYGGTNIRFVNARCRDNHCNGWAGRPKPTSGSLMYYAGDENGCKSTGIVLEQSAYWNACAPQHVILSKDPGAWVSKELALVDFKLRAPVALSFCWE